MHFSGDEVAGAACFCVKVCGKRLIVGVDGNHNAFILKSTLKDDLLVGHQSNGVAAVAQRLGGFLCLCELGNPFGQFVGLRLVKARTQIGVRTLLLLCLFAPFAAVVNARDARHANHHRVNERQMLFVGQNRCNAGHVVIVDKGQQMLALVQRPRLRPKLALQRMADFEHVHGVEGGV